MGSIDANGLRAGSGLWQGGGDGGTSENTFISAKSRSERRGKGGGVTRERACSSGMSRRSRMSKRISSGRSSMEALFEGYGGMSMAVSW